MDDFAYPARFMFILELGHQQFHQLPEPGPDSETILATLTERDCLLIGMALPALELLFMQHGVDCLSEASGEFQARLMELIRAQRPEWTKGSLADNDEERGSV